MADERGRSIDDEATSVLIDWTDGKLNRIANELDKLACFATDGEAIGVGQIEEVVGAKASSLRDLAVAVAKRDPGESLVLLDELIDGGMDAAELVSKLYGYWVALWLARAGRQGRRGHGAWSYDRLWSDQPNLIELASRRTSKEYAAGVGRFYAADVAIRRGLPPRPTVGILVYELASGC
jgi:DNA polymerase III delta subunit